MDWKSIIGGLAPVLGAAVGGAIALITISLQSKRALKDQCFTAFVKFHVIISSVTDEYLPAVGGTAWHDAYVARRRELEGVGDELIALTHLTISSDLATRVKELRVAFRQWESSYVIQGSSHMPGADRASAMQQLTVEQPRKILALLDAVTLDYRGALHRVGPRVTP